MKQIKNYQHSEYRWIDSLICPDKRRTPDRAKTPYQWLLQLFDPIRRGRIWKLIVVVLLCSFIPVKAQSNTAELGGSVKDHSGGALASARVTLVHTATGVKTTRTTDEAGRFLFPSLAVGEYSISTEMTGFKTSVQNSIILQVGQTRRLEIVLEVGNVTAYVTIAGSEPLLNSTSAEVSEVMENQRIVALPLNGRQFLQLALLSDGVVKPPGGTRGAALQQAGDLVNIAGQRSGHNIYLLDGVKVTDELFNNMVISPSIEAIQEFKIQKSMYSAEFGGKASALINVASKSGGNEYHGSVFEFLRNDVFDAKNFFDDPRAPIPPFRLNQFGGAVGGPLPLWRGKGEAHQTFFFANYEGQRINKSITKTFSVPTAAVRAGDFSGFAPIFDPLSTGQNGSRAVFSGNRIPTNRIDPFATEFLQKIPLPNLPGNIQNLLAVIEERTDMDQFNVRLDHKLSPNNSLFGRVSFFDVSTFQPFGSSQLNESLVPGFGRILDTRTENVVLSYVHTFNSNLINEFRFGWLNVRGGQTSENQGNGFASAAGLQGVTSDPRDAGYPQVSFGGIFSTVGDPTSIISRHDKHFEFFDNIVWRRGNHVVKFGGYLFHLNLNPSNPDNARGSFAFTNRWTSSRAGLADGNAFADFLLGYPSTGQVGIGRGEEEGRTNWLHLYVQDDWQVTPSLTINAGLRYEVNQHMVDAQNRLSAIDLSVPGGRFVIASDDQGNISPTSAPLIGLLPVPFVTSSEIGWQRGLLQPDYNRYAPRFGLAWKLPGTSQSVLRAGFGIFLNQWAYSVQTALARNLPFFLAKSVSTASDALIPQLTTRGILTSNTIGTIGGNNMDYDYRIEYNEAWSLSFQHLLAHNLLVEASYLGSRTVGADSSSVRNVPVPGPGPIGPRRPFPQLSQFNSIRWDGWSTYHALTLRAEKRLSAGITFVTNYTWSKSIDDASDPGATTFETNLPQDVRDQPSEKAVSSFDHRHRFVGSLVYELPFAKNRGGITEKIFANWQMSGIFTSQSGAPFTVNLAVDRANIGPGPAQRPNLLRNPNLESGQTPERWFDTAAFELPAQFTFGNAGRNIVYAPGYNNVDFALQKDLPLHERLRLKFRAEAFNVLNHTNFDEPNRIAFTSNFGRIFSAGPSRQIQFSLKLEF
jgi:hypothetical protein